MKLRSPTSWRAPPLSLPSPGEGPARGWGGRTVVVGIRRDATGRELLTWALAKVAAAGDRVVVLHVAATAAVDGGGMELEMEEKNRATDSLASELHAYDGFCNLKQISLELRVCQGSSVKRTLVNEASSYGAAHLILGVAKNSRNFGSSSTAVAKYCAKRVPQSCSVLAVSNCRVVYHRNAMQQRLNDRSTMVETPRRIYQKILDTAVMIGEKARDDSVIGDRRHFRRNISISMSAPVSPKVTLAPVPAVATGWPLLRKDIMPDLKPASPECSEMSVVQWAMQLPSRCSAVSSVNSDQTSDHRAVAPSRSDSAHPSSVIEEPEKRVTEELVSLSEKYSSMYTLFSYNELAKITSDFSPERIVGKGGASRVYMGCSEGGKELAVKVLKSSEEVMEEFVSEIEIISSVDHKNAMSLVGFCLEDGKLMLVYDYMRRGSLEELLHGDKEVKDRFGWSERFKVAVGVARALDYLHGGDGNDRPVIHRDVKSSNILISEDFEPKLCDFGLALWAADATSQTIGDDVAGTFGYLAPEYFMHGKVSDKIDVYAFGVVLLELISGRKPLSTGGPKGEESLVMWANSVVQGGKLMELVDASLAIEDGDVGEVERMTLAACLCIRRAPQRRPSIAHILKLLDGDGDAVKWAWSQVGVSGGGDDDEGDYSAATPPEKNDIQSYINLALLDVDDDSASVSSADFIATNMSLEEYMRGRWSRSSSFD